jgi:hypothetical protein
LVSSATYCNLELSDFIVPTLSPQIGTLLDDGKKQMAASHTVLAMDKPLVTADNLKGTFPNFFNAIRSESPERQGCIAVAARRYINSLSETDPIDRFSDLWEACEFLVKGLSQNDGSPIKERKPELRIEYVVWQQTELPRQKLHSLVKKLYRIRNDLVHNAMEDPHDFESKLSLLDELAKHVLRHVLRLGHVATPKLAEYCK